MQLTVYSSSSVRYYIRDVFLFGILLIAFIVYRSAVFLFFRFMGIFIAELIRVRNWFCISKLKSPTVI